MSDDLKRRLRDVAEFDGLRVAEEAVVRIEELEAKLRWVLDERDATFALMLKRAETAEAKLAKAVELALEECPFREGTINYDYWWQDYRTTLAELSSVSCANTTGGKDE